MDEMLSFMQLHRVLRDPSKVGDVLQICARALHPPVLASEIVDDIKAGRRRVPNRNTTARAFIHADCVLMLWRRAHVLIKG